MLSKCITFWYTCTTIWYLKFLDKNKMKAEMGRSDNNIQVLSKAFQILKIIKKERDVKISLGKIAKISNLPRSTVQRIVNSLVKENFLSQSQEKGIIIGNEIYKLAATNSYDVVRSLSPIINALSNKTRETVDLSILKDNHMLLLDRVLGTYRLGVNSKIGLKLPMSTTASGKSALSLLDVEKVKEFLENDRRGYGFISNDIDDFEKKLRHLLTNRNSKENYKKKISAKKYCKKFSILNHYLKLGNILN